MPDTWHSFRLLSALKKQCSIVSIPMKKVPVTSIRSYILVLAFCILSASIGYRMGEKRAAVVPDSVAKTVVNTQTPSSSQIDFSLFWVVWQKLQQSYIDNKTIDPQKMVWGAISGMVSSLGDPYTVFLPPKDNKDFKDELGGQFEGIGAQLGMKEGTIMVVAPLKDNPAEKAGIKAGDYILKVDGEDTSGWSVQQAVTKIRGPKGTAVKLTVLHEKESKTIELSIVRNTIVVNSVDAWIKMPSEIKEISGVSTFSDKGKVAYIRLSRFGDKTNDEWDKAVTNLVEAQKKDSSIKGLVFDLRNNPGGYLEGAIYIGSEFIKSGNVVSQKNSNGSQEDYPVMRKGKLLDIPLIVLVNKGSASAAEIVSGALRDYGRGKLVGETTFGKGSVQTPEDLPGGAGIHITTGKWLLPKGSWIHKVGVKPDLELELTSSEATMDAQLAKAVELLLK